MVTALRPGSAAIAGSGSPAEREKAGKREKPAGEAGRVGRAQGGREVGSGEGGGEKKEREGDRKKENEREDNRALQGNSRGTVGCRWDPLSLYCRK